MEHLLQTIESSAPWAESSLETLLVSLLLAFVLGQLVAWTYMRTRNGLALSKKEARRSRAFPQSLVLMAVVVTLVMLVIGNNIVAAFGLLGALAIVRFRNVLPETRDTVFVFFVLVQGIAIGSQRQAAAVLGTTGFVMIVLYLHYTSFGTEGRFQAHLLLKLNGTRDAGEVGGVLEQFCRRVTLVAIRQASPELVEHSFEIKMRSASVHGALVDALRNTSGVSEVSLVVRDPVI